MSFEEANKRPPSPINHSFCVKNVVNVVISKYHLQRDSNICIYCIAVVEETERFIQINCLGEFWHRFNQSVVVSCHNFVLVA